MALPASGIINLSDIQTEFGGANPISMSEYYRGGAYVTSNNTGVPTSGTINIADFYGATNLVDVLYHVVGAGGGGGGAGGSSGTAGGSASISGSGFTTVASSGGAGGAGGRRLPDTAGTSSPGAGGAGVTVGGVVRGAGGSGGVGNSNPPNNDVELGGAGGGGAGGTGGPAQGGGLPVTAAGQYKTATLSDMTPGTVITINVGSGGTGGLGYQSSAAKAGANGSDAFVRLTINGSDYDFTSSGTHTV